MTDDLKRLMERALTEVAGAPSRPVTWIRDYLDTGVNVVWAENNLPRCDVFYQHGEPQNSRALAWVNKFNELAESQHDDLRASYEVGHLVFGAADSIPRTI